MVAEIKKYVFSRAGGVDASAPPIIAITSPVRAQPADISHSTADYNSKVGNKDKLVVIDFHATWCGPCKAIAPQIEKYSKQYADVEFYKIDVDEVPDVAQQFGVRAMPTFKFVKNGNVVGEVVGANPKAVQAAIEQHK
ncbi:thioredoxin-domain-containing protein [Ascodesmis nigricans]|uniref:Thioredoxin-domain-containing protein n=1 Tax=Ascodesmis nigricans TaxID=341454 RepID=A0A4S2N5S7_9PEZI|nr:thioredoxin-domain-containing protein [Ascodesmis nigricans]